MVLFKRVRSFNFFKKKHYTQQEFQRMLNKRRQQSLAQRAKNTRDYYDPDVGRYIKRGGF